MTKAEEVLQDIKKEYPDMPYYDDDKLEGVINGEWGQTEEKYETGSSHRWITDETAYLGFEDGSWLAIDWATGNTEYQENEGPYEVYLVEPYETTVIKYRKIDG